ncbi:MAG: NAD-dependent epimerase/dehydratase family protein [Candidatus Electrothrix sp. EH2]|nr:NAD-dependent epimerase/dehydratase family protein [Candidatus Electrothrix sp. EH2]
MVKRWLITGGCGFIGTALIRYLLGNGQAQYIRVLDNLTVGTKKDLRAVCDFVERPLVSPRTPLYSDKKNAPVQQVELVQGDIRDPETCIRCCKNIDIIIHLAANTGVPMSVDKPRIDMECNVNGTFNMLEGARIQKVQRFVFASSGAPAGEVEPPIHEELPSHPVSPYGASKLAGEGYCSAYYRSFGIETVALRFSNVYGYGSHHKSSVVAKFIKQAIAGEPLEIYGDGQQTRDFIYIDDLVNAVFLSSTQKGIGGEIFQIATSRATTLNELVKILRSILDEYTLPQPKIVSAEVRLGDLKKNFSDTRKAEEVLGWKCRMELLDGLRETVKYFFNSKV